MEVTGYISRVIDKAKALVSRKLFLDFGDYRNTVFLAGSGRSGTTWVENIINYANNYRILFEPFHSKEVGIVSHFRYRQYIRPQNRDEKFIEPASKILSGDIRNKWVDQQNRKILVRKRLVKDIRANHFIKWIKQCFPEIPIILLLRHPCAVALSKLKLNWETHLEEFLDQEELMTDFLNPFRKEIEYARDDYDKHVFMWCIENYVPLMQFNSGEIHVAFYEEFCINPKKAIDDMFLFLKTNADQAAYFSANKPSALVRDGSAVSTGGDLTGNWRKSLSDEQISRAIEILDIFGMDAIYSEQTLPLINSDQVLGLFANSA